LLTDVWTTAGVVAGILLVTLTGWLILDPIVALVVTANIIRTGVRLLRETGLGLLDTALPSSDLQQLQPIFAAYRSQGIEFHALRTRRAGSRRFISFHVLVPGAWTVEHGHALCEDIEQAIRRILPETTVFTHLEPREDPISWKDQGLDREYPETPFES
jgi:cation diffusion facilitator family transporter